MAEFGGGGGGGAPPDILWIFPNTLSTDQNNGLFTYQAPRATSFVGFDIRMNVAPTGLAIIVDWAVNGVVNPAYRVTLPIGEIYVRLDVPATLAKDDDLQPIVVQVGTLQPGQTANIRALGS